jgi:hypothetical protein
LYKIPGRLFCVSHADPRDVERVHAIGQGVMLDNGAFTKFKTGRPTDWPAFYKWCDPWLDHPNTWAVIPDVIDAGSQEQDALIKEWPHGEKGAPVWHMDEPIHRLIKLTETWPLVCIGSSGEYWQVLSPAWEARMDECWEEISKVHRRMPRIHMLRGLQLGGMRWPFASLDSTNVAQNHAIRGIRTMIEDIDARQCPARFVSRPTQEELRLYR